MVGNLKVLLWDIDGTILNTRGAGVKPLLDSIYNLTKQTPNYDKDKYSGLTDHEIVQRLLSENGVEPSDSMIDNILENYALELENTLLTAKIELIKDFDALLPLLANKFNSYNVIATGNTARGAKAKLNAVKLYSAFSKHFCSDGLGHRSTIVKRAINEYPKQTKFCVIGDTPHDIEGAKRNSIPIISVATGAYSIQELSSHEPNYCLESNWGCEDLSECLKDVWGEI